MTMYQLKMYNRKVLNYFNTSNGMKNENYLKQLIIFETSLLKWIA